MGQQSSITLIDPQSAVRNQQTNQNFEELVKRAFKQASQNGRLTRDKFNEALGILESYDIQRMRDTPLSDRLYTVLDADSSGYLSETEYLKGLTMIINDKEKRITHSFKIYDKDQDGKIKLGEFYDFVRDSWVTAFRLLGEQVLRKQNKFQGMTQVHINAWAQGQLTQLYKQVEEIFKRFEKSDAMDLQTFRAWVVSGEMSFLKAVIDTDELSVPLHLYRLNAK